MTKREICPKCGKGFLRKFFDEAEKGIRVEALKCSNCKEIWYSEEIMERVESMQKAKHKTIA